MARETISDFLVSIGFDGKEVIQGVKKTEAALKRLKKTKQTAVKVPKDTRLEETVRATRRRIAAEQNLNRMKKSAANENMQALRQQKKLEQSKDAEFLRAAKTRLKEHKRIVQIDKSLTTEQAKRAKAEMAERKKQQAHLKRVLKQKAAIRRMDALNVSGRLPQAQRREFRGRISRASGIQELTEIRTQLRRQEKAQAAVNKRVSRQLTLQNAIRFSLRGITDSLKNFARSWVSVFAVMTGALAGLRFTQEFQALDASMLAVSENTKKAADNVKFIKDLSKELPVDIKKAGDNFKNMLASGRESMGQEGVQDLFTALSEFGTALQVDPQRMDRGMQAISQMLNKGQVMAKFNWSFKISLIAGTSILLGRILSGDIKRTLKISSNTLTIRSEVP